MSTDTFCTLQNLNELLTDIEEISRYHNVGFDASNTSEIRKYIVFEKNTSLYVTRPDYSGVSFKASAYNFRSSTAHTK